MLYLSMALFVGVVLSFHFVDASIVLLMMCIYSIAMFSFAFTQLGILQVKTKACLLLLIGLAVVFGLDSFLYFVGLDYSANIIYMVSSFVMLIAFARVFIESYKTDRYMEKGTYLVYKRPTCLKHFLVTLFLKHHAVSIVIDGQEFKYSKGWFVERQHIHSSKKIYKYIESVPIQKARLLVGTKWKLTCNCFTTIKGLSRGRQIKDILGKRGI